MKKIGLIILVAVLALGAMGAAYAAWSQTLNISGSVATAEFDVNFTAATSPTAPVGTDSAATNVISAEGKVATITVANAYPNYTGAFTLAVTNNSTIPVRLALTEATDTGLLFEKSADPVGTIAAGATYDYTITVTIPDWTGTDNSQGSFSATYTILASQGT